MKGEQAGQSLLPTFVPSSASLSLGLLRLSGEAAFEQRAGGRLHRAYPVRPSEACVDVLPERAPLSIRLQLAGAFSTLCGGLLGVLLVLLATLASTAVAQPPDTSKVWVADQRNLVKIHRLIAEA